MNHKFKLGDRVVKVRNIPKNAPNSSGNMIPNGLKGTIKRIVIDKIYNETTIQIGVEWDNFSKGHDCDGACIKSNSGFFVTPDMLESLSTFESNKIKDNLSKPNNRIVMDFF